MATGQLPLRDTYRTTGPASSWHVKNKVPERPPPVCYILFPDTCTDEVYAAVVNDTAVVRDYTVVGIEGRGVRSKLLGGSRRHDENSQRVLAESS